MLSLVPSVQEIPASWNPEELQLFISNRMKEEEERKLQVSLFIFS